MGNNSTSSSSSSSINSSNNTSNTGSFIGGHSFGSSSSINSSNNTSNTGSFIGGHSFGYNDGAFWSFSALISSRVTIDCHITLNMVWMGIMILILVTGLVANAVLMWMLLSSKKALSPSGVLGLNLSVLDIVYCFCMPLEIYGNLHGLSEQVYSVQDALSALNIFGCPLLLTFMCFERYLAVARPVAYLKLGTWEYRAALCACAWILTLAVALLAYFVGVFSVALYLALTTSALFLLMLLCLAGIVWVLHQSGPGEGSANNVPLKRRALKNILAVMVPAVVAYSPLVVLVPFMAVLQMNNGQVSTAHCLILHVLLTFPKCGLYIGPMFYLSHVRQLSCWKRINKGLEQATNSKTQAE